MEYKKLFIGNLNFKISRTELENLLNPFGTIINCRLNHKKGFAVIEMSSEEEGKAIFDRLNGKTFMERVIRIQPELPANKARKLTINRFNTEGNSMHEKRYSVLKTKRDSRNNKEHSAGKYPRKEFSSSDRPQRREWSNDRPFSARPNRTGNYHKRDEDGNSHERSSGSGYSDRTPRREWSNDRPRSSGFSEHGRRDDSRGGRSFSREGSGSSDRAPRREWSSDRPRTYGSSEHGRRDDSRGRSFSREGSGISDRAPRREWSSDRPSSSRPNSYHKHGESGPNRERNFSRSENFGNSDRPQRHAWSNDRPRTYGSGEHGRRDESKGRASYSRDGAGSSERAPKREWSNSGDRHGSGRSSAVRYGSHSSSYRSSSTPNRGRSSDDKFHKTK